tara:strand:- start:218 stop:595 length:378 start_codon:yes stop_codon:yes gene_type:complete
MGNAKEETGLYAFNPNKIGMRQLEMDPTAWGRSDLGRGMEGLMSGAAGGISHGIGQIGDTLNRSSLNVANWGPEKEEEQKAQTASANYTGQASTQRSGSGTRSSGKLSSDKKKSGKGKKALTITK